VSCRTSRGALLAVLLLAASAQAGEEIRILNSNRAGEGFNDPTAANPVGGNPGTTVGDQRKIAFQFTAALWSAALGNQVRVLIDAKFSQLQCGSTGTVLGAAGPNVTSAAEDPVPALANEIAGHDLDPSAAEIVANFNSFSSAGCNVSWYYGFDTPTDVPGSNLISVLQHEFAHGLGFTDQSPAFLAQAKDSATGKLLSDLNVNDIVSFRAAIVRPFGVSWVGPKVKAITPDFATGKNGLLKISSSSYQLLEAGFSGPVASFNNVTLVRAQDAGGSGATNACAPIKDVTGKLVIVDRDATPNCTAASRSLNAQQAGAVGVLIHFNTPGSIPLPFGDVPNSGVTIPVWSISLEDGNAVETAIGSSGAPVTIEANGGVGGMDSSGQLLLYTPSVLDSGSSVSHWDVTATPNLLMQPFLGAVGRTLDVTPAALGDVGWDIPGGVSIGASKLLRPDLPLGQVASFVIQVINRSSSQATGVVIDHQPDPGLTQPSISGACAAFPCSLGTLEPWAVRTIIASYSTGPQLGGISQKFFISAANPMPVTRAASVTVQASHLGLTATGPKTGASGQAGTYTFTAHNEGQDLVNSVLIQHSVSGPGTIGAISGDCGGTDVCRLPIVNPGETKQWTLTVNYTGTGNVTVTAATPGATAGTADVQTVSTDVSAPAPQKSGCTVASGPASAGTPLIALAALALLVSRRRRPRRR
jgi:MYXO-CTERM domain-containing protein